MIETIFWWFEGIMLGILILLIIVGKYIIKGKDDE